MDLVRGANRRLADEEGDVEIFWADIFENKKVWLLPVFCEAVIPASIEMLFLLSDPENDD